MNSVVRQLLEQETEVIMVDTGNSYEGIASYFGASYITYDKDRPISMNPFNMTRLEYDNNFGEKKNFLKSLIFLIFKGNKEVSKSEDAIIDQVINDYYAAYYFGFTGLTPEEHSAMKQTLISNAKRSGEYKDFVSDFKVRHNTMLSGEGFAELSEKIEKAFEEEVEEAIYIHEQKRKSMPVNALSFNTFYEYSIDRIALMCSEYRVEFDLYNYTLILQQFYRGGSMQKILNNDLDINLFDEKFIVFEIDNIKDDPILFPIVVLIIMDTFLQKMRLKKGRKALIIEEAWKAIASPTMAEYIKYLYKTVRKFNGIAGVVTQELNDVIDSPIVREAIINNSDIKILLDQTKFKDRYDDISRILGLTPVQKKQIFTINSINNKEGRAYFREVWICRGQQSDVYGVEEPPECYWAYTTERMEKEALKVYLKEFGNIQDAITHIEADRKKSGLVKDYLEFSRLVNQHNNIMAKW